MSSLTLRAASAADQPRIKAIIRAAGINPLGLKWRRFIVVTDDAGVIIGTGQIKQHGAGVDELASIAVIPERRGEGIARLIINRLLASHPAPLYLMCQHTLGSFYQRFNFQEIETAQMPAYFRRVYFLARVIAPLMNPFIKAGFRLVIMKRDSVVNSTTG